MYPHEQLDGKWYFIEGIKLIALVIVFLVFWHLTPSWSREGGDWSKVDPEIREWIKSLHRPDLFDGKTASCCGEGDAYYADLGEVGDDGKTYAVITDSRGNPLKVGTKVEIPPNKVQNKEGNPSGHVVVFANESGYAFCFVPNGSI